MATAIEQLVAQLYQQNLGREADAGGAEYFAGLIAGGATEAEVRKQMAQSLEGQNFLTQAITSAYRQNLARNPEQAGYQYWQSAALDQGLTAQQIRDLISNEAVAEQVQRGIAGGFTDMELAALEADPYGGRFATTDIFALPQDAVNVSTIGNRQAQFVNPITQQAVVSNFSQLYGDFSSSAGRDVLSDPVVVATLQRALNSGALDQNGFNSIVNGLSTATTMDQVRNVFAAPQAQVIVDAIYGQQMGEDVSALAARAEAAQRQAVLDANDTGYFQNNFQLADAYRAAGLDFPFGQEAFQGYDTMMRERDVVTPENFNERVNSLLQSIYGQFGGPNSMQTPQTGQFYSETGLQPGFVPFGTEGTTFRSGVAGFVPQAQLPTRFDFGAPPVDASFQQYRPGAFQPAGVTTGGFITGYTADGQPIYSQYNNPSQNVAIPAQQQSAQQAYNAAPLSAANFDQADYLARYPDAFRGSPERTFQHFLEANAAGDVRTANRLPFTFNQTSQLVNPSANLQTIDASATGMNQADFNAMMANYQAQQTSNAGG